MQELKANTSVKVPIGPFLDVVDGFTPQTDIDVATADEAEIMKHDAASVTDISGRTWAAITNMDGWYNLTLTTDDTNTEGMMTVAVQDDSDCLPVFCRFMVLSQAAYDSKYAAKDTGYMDVNTKAINDNTVAATNVATAGANYSATRGLTGTALPAAAADAAGGLPISDAGAQDLDAAIAVLTALTSAAATKMAAAANTIITGTVSNAVITPTFATLGTASITEATADHYNGRLLIFTSGNLQYQATRISDYELSGGHGKFTYASLTEAPANSDTFVII